jgi:hypothetical protein
MFRMDRLTGSTFTVIVSHILRLKTKLNSFPVLPIDTSVPPDFAIGRII